MPVSSKDTDYLDRLRDYYAENRRIPSWQRLAEIMGFASRTASRKLLERLEAEGFVARTSDDDAWIPTKAFFFRPLMPVAVRAGMPEMIEAVQGELFSVDDYVVRKPSETVLIPVKGDSMIDAGIHDGDLAVVERGPIAKAGDFVIAVVDDEYTLKELGREKGMSVLKPHNKDFEIIRPKGMLEIFGVMVGLVRRYAK